MANKANDAILMAILQDIEQYLYGNLSGNAASTAAIAMANIKRDGADQNDIHEIAANDVFDQNGDVLSKIQYQFEQHPEILEELDKFADENGLMQEQYQSELDYLKALADTIRLYLHKDRKYANGGKTDEPFPVFSNGQKCTTNECAMFQNDTLRGAGYSTYGNAWNIGNADLYWSGYDVENRPKEFDLDKVREYNYKASDKFRKDFDSKTMLDQNKKYIVNMFYKNSPAQESAYNEGRDGIAGTHTGYVSWNPNNNRWEVTHNIHGTIHVDPFTVIQGRGGQYGITAIFEPRKQNLMDKLKTKVRSIFAKGGQFQTNTDTINVQIGDKVYRLLVAETEEEKERGLMNVVEMDPDEGMLFDYSDDPQASISFWMKDTEIPLDIIFINQNGVVISVKQGEPLSEEMITEDSEFVSCVIELNINSGVKAGDKTDLFEDTNNIEDEESEEDEHPELSVNRLYVYGSDGEIQAELQGGERIFSRKSSKVIIRKAKKAYLSKEDKDYKSLGRYVFNEMKAQDNRDPEYINN